MESENSLVPTNNNIEQKNKETKIKHPLEHVENDVKNTKIIEITKENKIDKNNDYEKRDQNNTSGKLVLIY